MTFNKKDFRQELTDSIIEALERGVPPWRQNWLNEGGGMPFNPISNKSYRGGNVLGLMFTALQKGYSDPRWMTFKQAIDNGWHVRKGEHGTQVEFWKTVDKNEEEMLDLSDERDNSDRKKFIHRVYTVFNANQIDGIPGIAPKVKNDWDVIQSGESILQNSGAKIIHSNSGGAFYHKTKDAIFLPNKSAFADAADYYGVALHEIAHWSGASNRLNRETLIGENIRFGSDTYAREELRAELASVFLAAERGIPYKLDENASYINGWLDSLRQDKNEIFRAARDAHKATDFILALEMNRSLEDALAIANGITLAENRASVFVQEQPENIFHLNGKFYISVAPEAGLTDRLREMGARFDDEKMLWYFHDEEKAREAYLMIADTLVVQNNLSQGHNTTKEMAFQA